MRTQHSHTLLKNPFKEYSINPFQYFDILHIWIGSGYLAHNISQIAANSPYAVNGEDSNTKRVDLVVVLLGNGQALLVGIERAVEVRVVELEGLEVASFALCSVDVCDLVVPVFVVEEMDTGTLSQL